MADEPTTGLDVTVQAQILDLLAELQRERHMAVILVTHDLGVVASRADDIIVMYAGRIVERAPTRTLFHDTKMPYTRALMDSIPRLADPSGARLDAIGGRPPDLINPPTGCRFAPRCPYAQDKCRESEPPLRTVGSPGPPVRLLVPPGRRRVDRPAGARVVVERRRRPARPDRPGPTEPPTDADTTMTDTRDRDRPPEPDDVVLDVERPGGRVQERPPAGPGRVRASPSRSAGARPSAWSASPGCGKSTTGRTLVQVQPATSGLHRLPGPGPERHEGQELRELRTKIQMIFQDPISSLNPRRRIKDIVAEPLVIWKRGTKEERADQGARHARGGRHRPRRGRRPPARASSPAGSASASASPGRSWPSRTCSSATSRSRPSTCRSRPRSSISWPT